MNKRAAVVLALAVVATLALSGVALAKTFKFDFEVDLSDDFAGDEVIEASFKDTNKGEFLNCSYFAQDANGAYEEYLGQFTSDDPELIDEDGDVRDQVREACVDNFENRVE